VPGSIKAPFTELFTANSFPPAAWSVLNPDGATTWQFAATGNGDFGSALIQGFGYTAPGQTDKLASPVISYDLADSVKLQFDLAASPYRYSTAPGSQMDTLEVMVTKDCGNSFTTVYKKWGFQLQTTGLPGVSSAGFVPQNIDWRKETVDLSAFAAKSPLMIFFKTTNQNENNIYLDNIRFSTVMLPVQLKQEGWLVFPSPFKERFTVWHYEAPTSLQFIRVMNTAGQVVWSRQFSGNADKQVPVELTGKAAGVYLVELNYSDGKKKVVQRVVKQ
jgi:hypothetical protein